MPRGYRDDARTFLKSEKNYLEKGNLNRYAALVAAKRQLNIVEPALDLSALIPDPIENIVAQCPLYILDDDIVRFFQKIDEIEETNKLKNCF